MDIAELAAQMLEGKMVRAGTEEHRLLYEAASEARRVTCELNSKYRPPEEIRELMALLTGREVDESFNLFPPFYTDFGKNIFLGKNIFINACCCFQDQGGISIGDGTLIGHRVTIATINHGLEPGERGANFLAPVKIGKNVWLGAGAIVTPGVEIGDNAVVAAGAVVTKNVESNMLVAGVPARPIRKIA